MIDYLPSLAFGIMSLSSAIACMAYRGRNGGLHFFRLGCLGGSLYMKKVR